jgi:flagellar basal-body rod modification protein FlgD
MATPVSGITSTPQSNTNSNHTNSATSSTDKLANEQVFLQLFVSQLKNQDPLNPADGTQFVTQLAQFSQLEQSINMSSDLSAIRQQIAPATQQTASA